jgi:uncharacterized protein (TIGR02246 family)
MTEREKARKPEDLTRLFVKRANAGDAEGMAELYEQDAVMAFPPGAFTVGRPAIRGVLEQLISGGPKIEPEPPLPTVISGDIALTSTPPKDGAGARAQVVRRQADGTWLRVIDQPEFISTSS